MQLRLRWSSPPEDEDVAAAEAPSEAAAVAAAEPPCALTAADSHRRFSYIDIDKEIESNALIRISHILL